MLKLEAFSAKHGDALLLHYGTADKARLAIIDGGPKGVYKAVIRDRLSELGNGKAPRVRWVNVSHVDEDHVTGIISLFEGIRDDQDAPAVVDALFHNVPTPGDALAVQPASGAIGGATSERDRLERELGALIRGAAKSAVQPQSFQQGADLANVARQIQVPRNPAKGKRLLTGDTLAARYVQPLKVTVVTPSLAHFADLVKKWRDKLGPTGGVITAATKQSIDKSVTNLSSVVLLVEQDKHRILLTGDARADHILEGLTELGLLGDKKKTLDVDVLKLPHHGSDRTTDVDDHVPGLLERVRAKHYIVSADGRYDNPSEEILRRLVRAQGKRRCTVWFTTPEGRGGTYGPAFDRALAALRDEIKKRKANITVKVPAAGQASQVVILER